MATNSILQKILTEPGYFQKFVDNSMQLATYVSEWRADGLEMEFCAAKAYQEIVAEYSAATVGSVIAANAGKPTHDMPTAGELTGSISRIADEWQLDNARLEQFRYQEGRFNDLSKSYSQEKREAESVKLAKYLFDPFEKAVIAPQKRIDMLYFEGLFNGTQTVSAANNAKSNVSYTYELGVTATRVKVPWSDADNADPVKDIEDEVNRLAAKGKTVQRIRMSRRTFRQMCATKKLREGITQVGQKSRAVGIGVLSLDAVNEYFESALLPTIVIEKDRFVSLANGATANMTVDNRVVFQCAETVAVIKASDALERVDPLPNKVYATYDGNLVGYWRSDRGRFVDYEMYAVPVFTGKNNYSILKTDAE
jgi:hypothetical protein